MTLQALARVARSCGWDVLGLVKNGEPSMLLCWREYDRFKLVQVGARHTTTREQDAHRARHAMPVTYVSSQAEAEVVFGKAR